MADARVVLCAMPKSGSSYLTRYLYTGLGIDHDAPPRPAGGFPADWLPGSYAHEILSRRAFVWQVHVHPTRANLRALVHGGGLDRVVVHLRDPRQATLSWAHHALRLRVRAYGQSDAFYASPFEDQLESALQLHFPILCDWIAQWRDVARHQDTGLRVLVTDFDELRQDAAALGRRICDFYGAEFDPEGAAGIPLGDFYRKGESDEWRGVFTPGQATRCWGEMQSRGLGEVWAQ